MRFYTFLIFCLLVPNIRSQESANPAPSPETPYVEREEKQFNFFPGGKIEIAAGAVGSVRIVGWQKGSVLVEAEKIVYYLPPEEAKKIIQQNPIKIRWGRTSASISTSALYATDTTMEVNLTIYVPQEKTDIKAKVRHGNFSVDTVNGWIETTILEGGIDAKSLAGYFSASTQQGDIQAEMSGKNWRGLEFAAVTQVGSVNLLLPVDYSAALQLETRNGKISVDYPPQVVDGEPTPPDIVKSKNSQSLKAAVGDGGSPIKLATYSGDLAMIKIPQ
jgi:DUF4097 and DUF4098 domain-containing protein YvlB